MKAYFCLSVSLSLWLSLCLSLSLSPPLSSTHRHVHVHMYSSYCLCHRAADDQTLSDGWHSNLYSKLPIARQRTSLTHDDFTSRGWRCDGLSTAPEENARGTTILKGRTADRTADRGVVALYWLSPNPPLFCRLRFLFERKTTAVRPSATPTL